MASSSQKPIQQFPDPSQAQTEHLLVAPVPHKPIQPFNFDPSSFPSSSSHQFPPTQPQPEKQKLKFTTTSLHNLVISNSTDVIYYEIVTPKWDKHLTKISRLDPNTRQFDLIAELQNDQKKHKQPMKMRLYGGAYRDEKDFLVGGVGLEGKEDKRMATFRGKDGKNYTWRCGGEHRLELYREGSPPDQPVATYHRQKRFAYVLRISEYPYLLVDNEAMDTLDSLIGKFSFK